MNVLILLPETENAGNVYSRLLRERFPQLNITWVDHHDKVGPHIAGAEILMSFSPFMADHVLRDATQLKWIQVLGSGVDGFVNQPSLRDNVLITNGHGVQATPVSEGALGLMFALSREFPRLSANQQQRRWERWSSQLLYGRTLGILGVGQIAEALAAKAKALGMRVVGISSGVRPAPNFDHMYSRDNLPAAVGELDYFVLLTPLSPATHHIVNATVLKAMKRSAFLINVARGGVINDNDLIAALQQGQIRAAALDVFEHEPLPVDHPFWSMPNVIVSPHMAGLHSSYPEHIMPLLEQNIARFLAGDHGSMINIVRPAKS